MKVAFFTDSIQFEPSHIPPLVFIGFSIFWLVLSFLGFLLPKNPLIDRWKLPLTLVSFLPFSFLCYSQSKTATNPSWEGKIQKDLSIVSLYDTETQNTLEFSFSEFQSYIIESSQESKKMKPSLRIQSTYDMFPVYKFPLEKLKRKNQITNGRVDTQSYHET